MSKKIAKMCFCCDKLLYPVFLDVDPHEDVWKNMQPNEGMELILVGAYGSNFDCQEFKGVICDTCVEKHQNKLMGTNLLDAYVPVIDDDIIHALEEIVSDE